MNLPDPLSEALRSVSLTGAIFLDAELSAPWGFAAPAASTGARLMAPSAEHLILFHLLVEGEATARIPGLAGVPLRPGDIAILPMGDAHELWNGRGAELTDSSSLLPKILERKIVSERGGGGGRLTKFICGYIGCERQATRYFLAGLPPLFKTNIRRGPSGEWLENTIRHLAAGREPDGAGRGALLAKLAEALFIEALRRYMAELPPRRIGWLAAARDSAVSRALAAIHREPARGWTVASLAEQAGLSRTVFAERFTRLLGEAPLAYVSHCRMQLGARLLETTDDTVLQVALNAGYESEAAFNRAFKREFELPPARYRMERRASPKGNKRK
ncbi:AraC family transcriptional regulator [Frateuria hangzhouensis]|uniref:AraC family transcriptional regulator n=1 Tax=Frateuria hangzhouensis TaxID=2995589 RepID=UPI002260C10C|nr:AraC family transcriptional regulator [Frateuria sp. STR12]MCX7515177.1 AraC family transcriptional regulator [Frateuria sp. STR12]